MTQVLLCQLLHTVNFIENASVLAVKLIVKDITLMYISYFKLALKISLTDLSSNPF